MSETSDLVALVADSHQEAVLRTLLSSRRKSLGIRAVTFDVYVFQNSDPGVYRQAPDFLISFHNSHHKAIVMLDVKFPGSPGSREAIEQEIQRQLDAKGWTDRSQVIAIDPELETWVWSDSPEVEQILGQSHRQIRQIALELECWPPEAHKPLEPKDLFRAVLRRTNRPPSAAVFGQLAERIGLQRCTDPAFVKLRDTLRAWFGVE